MEVVLIRQSDYYALHRKPDDTQPQPEDSFGDQVMTEATEEQPNVNVEEGKVKISSIVLSIPIATPTTEKKSRF